MNKKGQTLGLAIMVAIIIFIVGMVSVNFLGTEITRTRSADTTDANGVLIPGLDCQNTAISDGTKLTCLAVDLVVPYFFILIISVTGGIIVARFLL